MTSMKTVQFSRPPTPLSRYIQNSYTPLTLDVQFQTNPLPSPYDNQSTKRKHNPRMTIICYRSFLQVGFSLQYRLINLAWLSLDFFHLAKANLVSGAVLKNQKPFLHLPLTTKRCSGVKVELKPHYLLFRGFIFLCVQFSKNIAQLFLFIIIHIFSANFAINLFYLHILKT